MWSFTAKFFGLKSHIAHGMYVLQKSLSLMQTHIQESTPINLPQSIEVEFRRPLFLPNEVTFYTQQVEDIAELANSDSKCQILFSVHSSDGKLCQCGKYLCSS